MVDAAPLAGSQPCARPARTAAAALEYAAMGWRVYPAERGGKRPLFSGWLRDATTDPALISRWWRRDAGAPNIGVVPGERFDVVDIEADHVAGFNESARSCGLPTTPMARSGGGGLHQ
jgi:Bifunctional DNA primase/polymerase, N-terminal